MKVRRSFIPFLILVLLVLLSRSVLGNGTVEPDWYATPLFLILLILFIGPLIESMIVGLFLSKEEILRIRIYFIFYFFVINLFTVPITQFLVMFLSDLYRTNLFLLAEIFPIIMEFFAIFIFINHYNKKKLMRSEYSLKYIFLMALVSNIATIIMGLFLYYFIK